MVCRSKDCKVTGHQTWWFDPGPPRTRADWFECGRGLMADFFVRPQTLTTGNFEAIWPQDLKFSAIKDLNRLKKYAKYQEASSILRVSFDLSKWPHLHRAYVVTVSFILILASCILSNQADLKAFCRLIGFSFQPSFIWNTKKLMIFLGIETDENLRLVSKLTNNKNSTFLS